MKVRNIKTFRETITSFKLVPARLVSLTIVLVLTAEFAGVVLLNLEYRFFELGFGVAFTLLSIFTLALFLVITRKIETNCNCFGSLSYATVTMADIVRNSFFIICSLVGWLLLAGKTLNLSQINLTLVEWLFIYAAAGVFSLFCTQLTEIFKLIRSIS